MQPLIDHARRFGQRPVVEVLAAEDVVVHVPAPPLRPRSCPCVGRRPADGLLRLHGRYHEVCTGAVPEYRPGADAFEAL
ncbi:hypothetical protein [Streptomyces sp. NPDC056431]|uniref:hypothetical protein n=1 Tax=Streptomyces sp. NPDC056431 TaxID=3345814 RepID=UPI003692BC89